MMVRSGRGGRAILLAVTSSGIALLALMVGAVMAAYAVIDFGQGYLLPEAPPPLQVLVLASAVLWIGILTLITAFHSIRRLRATDPSDARPQLLKLWQALVLVVSWIACALVAQFLVGTERGKWLAPLFYILAISIPIYILVRLAAGGLAAGSLTRFWGLLTTGMFLGTSLAVIAELLLAVIALIVAGIYLALHPELLSAVERLATQLTQASGVQETLSLIEPWINTPVALMLALGFFAVFSPVIEELSKSIPTWLVWDRLRSPADGFVAGALSGAGFGLLESLFATATPDSSWAFALVVRGGSSMMHTVAAGLTGWGIASFRLSRRRWHLVGAYLLAICIHSVWNASVIGIAFGGLGQTLNSVGSGPASVALVAGGTTILIALCLTMILALSVINRKLRSAAAPAPEPQVTGRPLAGGES